MKQLVFLILVLLCTSCTAQKEKEIASVKNEDYLIMFDFLNIWDAHYSTDDSNFWIEYDDPDAFDLEAMADRAELEEWPTDYLLVTISENLIDEFIEDWNRYEYLGNSKEEWEEKFQLSYKYALKEYYVENIPNFKIVKVDGDWFSGEPVIVEE